MDLNNGRFVVHEEVSWFFKSKEGHVWIVDRLPDKLEDGVEMTEEGLDTISVENGFNENPGDKMWPIYPRVTLVKRRVLKKQKIKVRILENPTLPTNKHS